MTDFSGAPTFDDDDLDRLVAESVVTAETLAAQEERGPLVEQWPRRTLADAYAPRPPRRFLIDGLLPVPSLSIVFGGPGSLKSMMLADMAACIAAGKPWLESMPSGSLRPGVTLRTSQAKVLWIDFDNGALASDERFEAIGRGHELPADASLDYVSMPYPWLDASDRSMAADLIRYVKHYAYELVIIDNLGLVTGNVEENSGEMARVMGHLRGLSERTGSAVIVVHHQRKSSGAAGNDIPKGETLRGHSTINAALDLALLVDRKTGDDSINIIPTKVRGYSQFDVIGALFTYEHKPGTKELQSARFWSKSVETSEQIINLAIKANIRQALKKLGLASGKEIVDDVRDYMAAQPGGKAPPVNKARGLLREMVEDGDVEATGGRKDRQYKLV